MGRRLETNVHVYPAAPGNVILEAGTEAKDIPSEHRELLGDHVWEKQEGEDTESVVESPQTKTEKSEAKKGK